MNGMFANKNLNKSERLRGNDETVDKIVVGLVNPCRFDEEWS